MQRYEKKLIEAKKYEKNGEIRRRCAQNLSELSFSNRITGINPNFLSFFFLNQIWKDLERLLLAQPIFYNLLQSAGDYISIRTFFL
jgi:hypothetical protein